MASSSRMTCRSFSTSVRVVDGLPDHVGQNVERLVEVGHGHLAPVGGELPVRGGVHDAAHALDGLRDFLRRRVAGRALEAHVLHVVRYARLLRRLVARARAHVEHDARRLRVRHTRGEDAKPVVRYRLSVCDDACSLLVCWCRDTKRCNIGRLQLAIIGLAKVKPHAARQSVSSSRLPMLMTLSTEYPIVQ